MSDTPVVACAWLLAATFAWAAIAKLTGWHRWREALTGYELPGPLRSISAVGVPLAEMSVAGLVVLGSPKPAAAATVGLTAVFSLAIARARARRGDRIPCGCFGGNQTRDFRQLLARNALIVVVAALVLLGPDVSTRITAPRSGDLVPAILVVVGLIAVAVLALGAMAAMRQR